MHTTGRESESEWDDYKCDPIKAVFFFWRSKAKEQHLVLSSLFNVSCTGEKRARRRRREKDELKWQKMYFILDCVEREREREWERAMHEKMIALNGEKTTMMMMLVTVVASEMEGKRVCGWVTEEMKNINSLSLTVFFLSNSFVLSVQLIVWFIYVTRVINELFFSLCFNISPSEFQAREIHKLFLPLSHKNLLLACVAVHSVHDGSNNATKLQPLMTTTGLSTRPLTQLTRAELCFVVLFSVLFARFSLNSEILFSLSRCFLSFFYCADYPPKYPI